jgi:site-specific DNA recombinase
MKKLRRIEPVIEENKKLKVAAYCRVSTKSNVSKVASICKYLTIGTAIRSNPQREYTCVYFDYDSGLRQKVVLV